MRTSPTRSRPHARQKGSCASSGSSRVPTSSTVPAATAATRSSSRASAFTSSAPTGRRCSSPRRGVAAGTREWPRWIHADYRELPFEDASFDCVANLFSSLGYWGEEGDRQALTEFRRVLRPGGTLVIETMHRDRLMAIYVPRHWHELPDGSLLIEERTIDYGRGTTFVRHELVEASGKRTRAHYEMRVYTATELIGLVRDAGFEQVVCHGDFDGTPLSRDTGSSSSRARCPASPGRTPSP